jgi:hypothetical protein
MEMALVFMELKKGRFIMLVTFSCDAYENITLFGDIAKHLLKMMGHSGTVPGAILAQDVPAALMSLQRSIEQERNKKSAVQTSDDEEEPEVSIVHRAVPLIKLLQAAQQKDCNVMFA